MSLINKNIVESFVKDLNTYAELVRYCEEHKYNCSTENNKQIMCGAMLKKFNYKPLAGFDLCSIFKELGMLKVVYAKNTGQQDYDIRMSDALATAINMHGSENLKYYIARSRNS